MVPAHGTSLKMGQELPKTEAPTKKKKKKKKKKKGWYLAPGTYVKEDCLVWPQEEKMCLIL